MLRLMRSWRPPHRPGLAIPLALAFLWSSATLGGCDKAEDLANKVAGKEDEDAGKDGDDDKGKEDKGDAADEETKDDPEKVAEVKPEPEPIPVEPLHTGLDLMLSFVPDTEAEYMIIRDASVLADYYEEGMRFLDAPLKKLSAQPATASELRDVNEGYAVMETKGKEVVDALKASGLRLKDGGALIRMKGGKSIIVFAADDHAAIANLAKAMGEDDVEADNCGPLAGHEGWSVCADEKSVLDAYKPAEDPKAVREALQAKLPGVELDEANVIARLPVDGKDAAFAVTTLPGLVHLAANVPLDREAEQGLAALEGGDTHTLANVQPGAGFMWGRANGALLGMGLAAAAGDAPPEIGKLAETLTGEFVLAGSVDPGGLVFQAGIKDAAPYSKAWEIAMEAAKEAPQEIPELKGSELTIEKVPVNHGTTMADALHVKLRGIPEADIVKAFAGLHFDGWAFAANKALTIAVGPDTSNVGKLLDTAGDGISADTLSSLPAPLAEGFKRKEVAFAMHLPADFMQGDHMHKLLRAALKNVPDADPETVIAGMALLAPVSSGSVWIEKQSGGTPIVHMAVQGIGNRATEEGRAALDAAHQVTEGTPPADAFAPLATKYDSSAMAFAYHTRAGSEGPGSLVGSGVGAMVVAGAVGYAAVEGLANESLAEDLGVKPDDPEPEIIPEHKPVVPEHKPVEPKDDKKADGKKNDGKKADGKKNDGKKADGKKDGGKKADDKKDDGKKDDDDLIVEPDKPDGADKPKPPVPKPSVDDEDKAAKKKKKKKKKKGKKKKKKKKKKG